jgi:squalene synthase HpnD
MTAVKMPTALPSGDSELKVKRSSFYTALRLLPAAQRAAMFEIYGFCRDVDDIADGGGPSETRLAELRDWRADIDALYQGRPCPRTRNLVTVVQQFDLKQVDFQAVIDGVEMDVTGAVQAPSMVVLDLYCDRVASAVGRLSVRIFGMEENDGLALSHHLGRALQLTNILRDIDEDAEIGRLYLPREALLEAGILTNAPRSVAADPATRIACVPVIAKAQAHFAEASAIMARSPRQTVRSPLLMCKAYQTILNRLIRRGFAPPRAPVRVSKIAMLGLILRYGIL